MTELQLLRERLTSLRNDYANRALAALIAGAGESEARGFAVSSHVCDSILGEVQCLDRDKGQFIKRYLPHRDEPEDQ